MRFIIITILSMSVGLAGCAAKNTITPTYINPINYTGQTCDGLASEIRRISLLTKENENTQTTLSGFGIGITGNQHGIYPTISFGIGKQTNSQNQTLAKLYGEHDAMVVAARQKGCAFAKAIKIYGE